MEPMPCWSCRMKMNLSCLALKSFFGPQRKSGRDTRLAAPVPTGFLPAHGPCRVSWAPGAGRERGAMAKMIPEDSGTEEPPHLTWRRTGPSEMIKIALDLSDGEQVGTDLKN